MFNEKAKWIWKRGEEEKDSYVVFLDKFNFTGNGKVELKICAETNYVAFINGKKVSFGQFPTYPTEKYFDVVDVSSFCVLGDNELEITVWYEGFNSFTHIDDGAGLIYSIENNNDILAFSSEKTLSANDNRYVAGHKQLLTIQVGYASKMNNGVNIDFEKSKVVHKCNNLVERPVKKLVEEEFLSAKEISPFIYDLGAETAGYLSVRFICDRDCVVTVSYGEYLKADGKVPRILPGGYKGAGRDFSLDFYCKKGENNFTNYFTRLAGRYLEVTADALVKVGKIGLIPVNYPLETNKINLSGLDKEIYDTCIKTLRLCMHEHYEDCPWREQALYSLDSRNQMLCGYYAFKDTSFQRANLIYISKGKRSDGILELTYPAINTPAIPFFSLIYVVAVGEYIEHTGDYAILDSIFETVSGIMNIFTNSIDDKNLIPNLPEPFWNFYEWSTGSDSREELIEGTVRVNKHDLILNCAYLLAIKHFEKMLAHYDKIFDIDLNKVKDAIKDTFFDTEKQAYFLSDVGTKYYSQLGNAFVILVGLGNRNLAEKLITDESLIEATLSMLGFVYDAILYYDNSKSDYVLNDIRKNYGYMLSKGATSFWETILGVDESASSSLCHGWSAMPVYYYHKLLGVNNEK